ncbi:MAG TPA: DUF1573 domain-containing protein [Firmicutes bacterium]|nr:DUF1573 domain-containing protein [Bacillota bacterium]HHY97939.1 DUF1573 domain-containing protein [Bacillota bacterium]
MRDLDQHDFQETVSACLIRHRSILDCLSKLQESSARVNRAVTKSVTCCGCLQINAKRQCVPENTPLAEAAKYMSTHIIGSLCPECREVVETELGGLLFYLVAVCTILGLDVGDILEKEQKYLSTLGVYNLL